ncbi:MAG: phenylalanine--tRNA ligase subunit beta [Bacilli bacterium]|jgi:phenylalanyl-tRNA synthetase beta chain
MKASINVLKTFVDIEGLSAEEIAKKLTFAGIEVESISHLAYGEGLVIGEVLKCEKMVGSDHLHICQVDMGKKCGVHQIVCGAPNVAIKEKVIVARDGAKLLGGTIKKGLIRNVESDGMLCSYRELGVDDKFLSDKEKEGIALLDKKSPVGEEDVLSYLGLDDSVLELKILANRSDLMSLANIAKEIALLFNRKLIAQTCEVKETFKSDFKVGSETKACPQFSIRVIKGIRVGPSPRWMKDALRSMGIRSINNIVDVGNYVMLVTGQPLHMYDLEKIPAHELIVKDNLCTKWIALDGNEYLVEKDDLTVTSKNRIMCLGGVMGSLESAVDEKTHDIVIEAANFDFARIRRTSNRLGLASESSLRFSKGINPNQYTDVLNMASFFVRQICGADGISNIITSDALSHQPLVVRTTISKINNRLGTDFSYAEIADILKKDYLDVASSNKEELTIRIPSSRIDISSDADISEEVIRLFGFDRVKKELPRLELTIGHLSENYAKKRCVRDYLKGCGLDEVVSYSLIKKDETAKMAILSSSKAYRIINPMTDEHEYMRTNLMHSLLAIASYNVAHQNSDLHFFEVSDVFSPDGDDIRMGIVLLGKEEYQHKMNDLPYSFYHMKGYLAGAMHVLGLDDSRYSLVKNDGLVKELHPGKSALIQIGKDTIGYLGELHPNKVKEYDLGKSSAIVLELDLSAVFAQRFSLKKFVAPSRYPSVRRDIALLLSKDISSKDVISCIKKCDRSLVKEADVFDEYIDEKLSAENKKSLAISIVYSSKEETLKDETINALEQKIVDSLKKEFAAELRK